MSNNPFSKAIADAEEREVEQQRLLEEEKRIAELSRHETIRRQSEQRRKEELCDFGRRFLEVVVQKVVKVGWKPGYIKLIQQFSEALLMMEDQKLPMIDRHHRTKILEIFSYGLTLAAQHNVEIPEGLFYGQRVLAEQQPESVKQQRLDIKPGRRLKTTTPVFANATAVSLRPAITPKGGRAKLHKAALD